MPYQGSHKLTTAERDALPDSAFGIPESREFPIIDASHVRAAEAYFRHAPEDKKPSLARFILRKAEEYGVDVESETIRHWAAK